MKQLIILTLTAIFITYVSNTNEYIEIPSSSIRIRVIANSNSDEDQGKKIIIKSILEEKIYDLINETTSLEEADKIIINNQKEIDNYLQNQMIQNNINLKFSSSYGLNYFPQKVFKGVSYKAGNYKSYVVTLGEGKGDNWWCVLYPPLCLIDENVDDYEYHSLINDTLKKYN